METAASSPRSGFTLFEVLLFTAIFSIMAVAFAGILVMVTRVQTRQGSAGEVNEQSRYLLQTIQAAVERSSHIDVPSDQATTSVKLRMASSTEDPIYIYETGGTVYFKKSDVGTPQALTSNRVVVDSLSFTKHTNPGGRDTLSVSFGVSYNSASAQQQFSASSVATIRRVSAATFDSSIVPSTGNTYKLGLTAADWQSINSTIYFFGSNVGIGVQTPSSTLEVNGGIRLNTTTARPTCDATVRGTVWLVENSGTATDTIAACMRNGAGSYFWASLYP